MNKKKRTKLERDIVASLQVYRLDEEIRILETKSNLVKTDVETKRKFRDKIKDFLNKPITSFRSNPEEGIEIIREDMLRYLDSLEEDTDTSYAENPEELKKLLNVYFDRDDGRARVSMALEVILAEIADEKPRFQNIDQSRESVSEMLFGDPTRMEQIKAYYDKAYSHIGRPTPTSFSRGFLYGLAAGSVAMLGPRLLSKILHLDKDAAPIRHLLGTSTKALCASELLHLSTLIGGGYVSKRKYRRKNATKMRNIVDSCLNYEIAYSIATAITVYEFALKDKEESERKEAMDLLLKMIDDIRSDAEYLALVEGKDPDENQKKISVCDNAIAFLLGNR